MRCFACRMLGCELTGEFWIAPHQWFVLYSDGELLSAPGRQSARCHVRLSCGAALLATNGFATYTFSFWLPQILKSVLGGQSKTLELVARLPSY